MNKGNEIKNMLREGRTYGDITRELGVASSTIAYHAKIIGKRKYTFERKTYDWDEVQKLYDEGLNYTEISEAMGVDQSSIREAISRGSLKVMPSGCAERQAIYKKRRDYLHSVGKGRTRRVDDTKIFCENSRHGARVAKQRIIKNHLLPYCCSNTTCPLHPVLYPTWCDAPIVLHLDHKNGIRNDHRIENLRWLCPNCHTQTVTYCGRNVGKYELVRGTGVEPVYDITRFQI